MRYLDSQEVLVGDRVSLGGGMHGVVVADMGGPISKKEFWCYRNKWVLSIFLDLIKTLS
jgi:hypothetical protein